MNRSRETKATATRTRERAAFLIQELKATNDNAGTFEGYVAAFNNLDQNGDIIERGAFKRTLGILRETKQKNKSAYLFPLLWQHDENEPIGGVTDAYEDDYGLHISGEYDLATTRGAQAYSGAKKGYLRGLSIGYRTVKAMVDAQRSRHLLEVQLFEGSPVTFPANVSAQINDVKAVGGKTDWALADYATAWDGSEAHNAIVKKATKDDGSLDTDFLKSVHFWYDPDKADQIGGYKLLFCDVIGGEVKAVPKGVQACTGSHGIQGMSDLSSADETGIKAKIKTYYGRIAKAENNPDLATVPWEAKRADLADRLELKQLTGLAALTQCAIAVDNTADSLSGVVDVLAASCGLALDDGATISKPQATVAALLAGVPGLEDAVKAVLTSYMEFSQQTDALLDTLGLPDNNAGYAEDSYISGYGYMSLLRGAFEEKVGRQLSSGNRDRLAAHAKALQMQVDEVKSILKDNDNPLKDENDQSADYGDLIASGKHNQPSGKSQRRDSDGNRTTPSNTPTSAEDAFLATLAAMETDVASRQLESLLG